MEKKCLLCGTVYIKKINESMKYWDKKQYCCRKCNDSSRKGKPAWNKGRKETRPEVIERQSKARIGVTPWNKGITPTKETREKISKTLMGRPTGRTGEKCNFWKGGKTIWRMQLCNSIEYKNWRRQVFERDSYTCQECGDKNFKGRGKTVLFEAHHIKPVFQFPELATELSNGITLCKVCHRATSSWGRQNCSKGLKNL